VTATIQKKTAKTPAGVAVCQCACGKVRLEVGVPVFWAWHDHSRATQRAHGTACATYVGCWKSKVCVIKGENAVTRFVDAKTRATRSFCSQCGTPLLFERARAPKMVNIPRALFDTRTGREPRYHIAIDEAPEWAYRGEALVPLKGFPGVVWERPGKKKALQEGLAELGL
jgi:hypothetical protein